MGRQKEPAPAPPWSRVLEKPTKGGYGRGVFYSWEEWASLRCSNVRTLGGGPVSRHGIKAGTRHFSLLCILSACPSAQSKPGFQKRFLSQLSYVIIFQIEIMVGWVYILNCHRHPCIGTGAWMKCLESRLSIRQREIVWNHWLLGNGEGEQVRTRKTVSTRTNVVCFTICT